MRFRTPWTMAATAALLLATAACSDDEGGITGPGDTAGDGTAPLTLSLAVKRPPSPPASAGLFDLVLTDGSSTLNLTRVAIVLREIELERLSDDDCDDLPGVDDDCEEFEAGPILLEMPLDGSVETVISVDGIKADIYDEIEFDVHKPDDDGDPADAAFLAAHPDFLGVSIRVEGEFDGVPFVFTTDMNEEQERALVPPLEVVDGAGPVNLTFLADLDGWFRDASGSLIDPATANEGGPNSSLVDNNIERSLEIFEDDDHDGDDDHLEGDDS